MTTINDLIVQHCGQSTEDDNAIAKRVVDDIADVNWRDIVRPLVADQVRRYRRKRTRQIEATTIIGPRPAPEGKGVKVIVREAIDFELLRLVTHSFFVGNGERVTWGAATVDQHEIRIDYMEQKRQGLARTIDKHRQAVAAIRSAEVTCLNDLVEQAA